MNDKDSNDPLIVRHEAPLGWLILNRPQVRNALNLRTWIRIAEGVAELEADSGIRVIVMRGATPEAFISGADISEFPNLRADAEQARAYRDAPSRAVTAMLNCPKPVIAMISGVCVGGGVQVALSCDIRLAARGTRFGVPAARLGLAYPLEGVIALMQIVGPANARDILLSARLFDADEAAAMGLVNKVVPDDRLEEEVEQWCEEILSLSPSALEAVKLHFQADSEHIQGFWDLGSQAIRWYMASPEAQEGVNAFIEKRKPDFWKYRK